MLHHVEEVRSSEIGIVGTLFLNSLDLFRACCNVIDNSSWSATIKRNFKSELESYLLWGNHYKPRTGWLDRIVVASSKEFRDGVLVNIGNIGQLLCRRM